MSTDRAKILKWIRDEHLPEGLPRVVAKMIGDTARDLESLLPEGDQGDVALHLLVTAKDYAVRAVLDNSIPDHV